MCLWQRWPHLAAIGFGLLALAAAGSARPLLIGLAALAIGISGAIGGFHAGVEYGWWEGLTACSTALPTGGDPLEAIMNAPITRCDVAPWGLLGISLAGYNFLLSMGSAALILALLMLASRRSKP
jgi:disulfide bond formation protein DsbB